MNFTNLMAHAGVKQNALGRGGFAGVNVRGNTDVAVVFNGCSAGHKFLSVRQTNKR
jgi:hypothetical protein